MFGSSSFSGHNAELSTILEAVQLAGEPAFFSSLSFLGDLETITNEVRRRGLRMAAFPPGGLTVLPMIPVEEKELHIICEEYCREGTPQGRAEIRRKLFLRRYPLFHSRPENAKSFTNPADCVIKIAEICYKVAHAPPNEVASLFTKTPYLHIHQISTMCQRIRNTITNSSSVAQTSLFREHVENAMDATQLAPVPAELSEGVRAEELFHEDAVEKESPEELVEDLTGEEIVDHVKDTQAEYVSENDYELITRSSIYYDEDEGDGRRLAAVYITDGIAADLCKSAARVLEPAATTKNLRALTNGGAPPDTGIVGYYDYLTNPTTRKCRETAFMRDNWSEVMNGCQGFLQALDRLYSRCAPLHHNLQHIAIPLQYQLFGTVFSTMTVNHNFRTAVHTDRGDFRGGLGALCVLDGNFEGCHLAIKKLKKSFRLKPGDVLLFDTSLEHGNTEVHSPDFCWNRVSVVCYLRNGLMSSVCELERRKHLNRLIIDSLHNTQIVTTSVNINGVDEDLPPIYVPPLLARKLAPVQLSALNFAAERAKKDTGCVLAMTMGLGKTLVALTLCYSYLYLYPQQDILIVTPKPIINHWVEEHKKWSAYGLRFNYLVASEGVNKKFEEDLMRFDQQLNGAAAKVGHVFILNPEYINSFLRRFKRFDPSLIIVDEGHRVATKGNKLIESLSRLQCNLRIVLSGTPLQNDVSELYRLVCWVNRDVGEVFPPRRFQEMATVINRYIEGGELAAFDDAVMAQQFILDWMKGFVYREMENDLPPLHDYLIVCGSSEKQREIEARLNIGNEGGPSLKANEHRPYHLSTHPLCYFAFVTGGYQSMIGNSFQRGENGERPLLSEDDAAEVNRYYQLVQDEHLEEFVSQSGKLLALVKIIKAIQSMNEKVIIFSQYIGAQDLIHRTLTAFEITTFTVRGRDSQERRRLAMDQFAEDPRLVALVLSTKIAAYGLDFTAANHVVLFDSWWNPQMDAQAIARAYRRNQVKPVVVYRLASKMEDQFVLQAQTRKVALFNCLMHEKTSRKAQAGELEDCAETEENLPRHFLWRDLKTSTLEGGHPLIHNVYHYRDTVREGPSLAPPPPPPPSALNQVVSKSSLKRERASDGE